MDKKLSAVLQSVPPSDKRSFTSMFGWDSKQKAMWKKMRPLTTRDFEGFWRLVEPTSTMIDIVLADLKEWKVKDDECTLYCAGMQHRDLKKDHGIARVISSEGSIHERTLKEGKFHGLHRAVFSDKVRLSIYREGVRIAYLAFDHSFREIYRNDPNGYLGNI